MRRKTCMLSTCKKYLKKFVVPYFNKFGNTRNVEVFRVYWSKQGISHQQVCIYFHQITGNLKELLICKTFHLLRLLQTVPQYDLLLSKPSFLLILRIKIIATDFSAPLIVLIHFIFHFMRKDLEQVTLHTFFFLILESEEFKEV